MTPNKTSSTQSEPNAPKAQPGPGASPSGDRKAELYLQHPQECPELAEPLTYLIHPPSKLASTASWTSFRDQTLLPLIQQKPDDRNLPLFLKQAETILAWRAAVPPVDRFWKPD